MGKKRIKGTHKGKNGRSRRLNPGEESEELPTMLRRMYEGLSSVSDSSIMCG